MSDPDRHEQITDLFLAASSLPASARPRFLDEQCGADADLRARVEEMLQFDDGAAEFLGTPALGKDFQIRWTSARPQPDARNELPGEGSLPEVAGAHPDRVGDYGILEVIGEGGMGIVYLAEQQAPRRRVALKVIRPGLSSPRMLGRFEHEVHVLGRLQHPGIAQIYEAGIADAGLGPQPFFAMEYVEGLPLSRFVEETGLPTDERLELVAAVSDAVHHAHQKGVIHRDLKPGNIIVTNAGHPKIVDFGVARATNADVRLTTYRTNICQPIGTVPYMSPEQATGDPAEVDTRSDVYALGVILYELLAGRLPYEVRGKMVYEAIRVITEEDLTPLGEINRVFRGDLETIVATALQKDRQRRYQSASDLAADLRRFLRNEPIVARPPSTVYRMGKFARRHRAACVGLLAVMIALVLGVIGTTWQAVVATAQRNRAQNAERRAEHRFAQVRELANTFIFDVHDEIQTLAGATQARKLLVETALRYLDSLSAESAADAALQAELAEAYIRVGRVQGHVGVPNLGDTAGALASFRKAYAIRSALLATDPADSAVKLEVAQAVRMVAELEAATGESKQALANYERAIDMAEEVAIDSPDPVQAQRLLANIYRARGGLHARLGDTAQGLADVETAISMGADLTTARQDDTALASELQRSHYGLGRVQEVAGLTAEALASFQTSTKMADALCKREPDNASFRRELAVSHAMLGDVLNTMGRADEALGHFREQLRHTEALAEADPHDRRALQDLGYAYERIGFSQQERGEAAEALLTFQRGLDARAAASSADPNDAAAAGNWVISLLQIGDACQAVGQQAEAVAHFNLAVDKAEALAKQDPADSHVSGLLAAGIERLGKLQQASGNLDAARATYQRMFEICAERASTDPANTAAQQDLSMAYNRLGNIAYRAGDHAQALVSYEAALKIRQALATDDPADAVMQLHMIDSYERIGRVLIRMDRPQDAAGCYQHAIDIHRQLAADDPKYEPRRKKLAYDYLMLGEQQLTSGSPDLALISFKSCLDLRQALVDAAPMDAQANLELASVLERLAAARKALGTDDNTVTPKRRDHLQLAVTLYERSHATLVAMQQSGLLSDNQQGLPDQLAGELASCRALLDAVNGKGN